MIKELLKKHKICIYNISVTSSIMKKENITDVPKYNEIGTHSGRRTFIARCFRAGFNITDIMGFTGHKKVDTLLVYRDLFEKIMKRKKGF